MIPGLKKASVTALPPAAASLVHLIQKQHRHVLLRPVFSRIFLRRQFKFTMDVYYKNLQDIITYNVDNVSINYLGNNDARGWAAGVDMKLFGEFVPGVDSWISVSLMGAKEDVYGDGYGYIPRPMDQLFNVSLFFQDYIPGIPQYHPERLFWIDW